MKETGGFMRAVEENLTEISEENGNISWSSNTEKIKEVNSLDNMGVTSRTKPIVNYQEGQNITKKDHKINNATPQTDNTIMKLQITWYIMKLQKKYIQKSQKQQNQTAPAIITQEIEIKHTEQEVSKTEIIKGVVENGETIEELEVKSCEKGKRESKVEIIEVKLVEKTATQKEYHNIGEIIADKVPVETANIESKTKQQDNDIVAKKTSNYQQQKEATGNG